MLRKCLALFTNFFAEKTTQGCVHLSIHYLNHGALSLRHGKFGPQLNRAPVFVRLSLACDHGPTLARRVLGMDLLTHNTVPIAGAVGRDRGTSPAEQSMRRIIRLGCCIDDAEVQWLMKQTDLVLVLVWNGAWEAPLEERQNLIRVIERFVSCAIRGPLGVDIREAAEVFSRYRLEFVSNYVNTRDFIRVFGPGTNNRDLSRFALFLAFDLEQHAPSLPTLLSDPDFPLDSDRRHLFASLSCIRTRLRLDVDSHALVSIFLKIESREYWEMLLDVCSKVEDRYIWLCQETGVDVAYTYRPIHLLRSISWGVDINEDYRLVQSVILPFVNDPQIIEFAATVGQCLDFALRHHPFGSIDESLHSLVQRLWGTEVPNVDGATTCRQLMMKGLRWVGFHRPLYEYEDAPSQLVDDGFVLTDFRDSNPPIPMNNADTTTIRVSRLVEVVALRVPEIREVFQLIDSPTFMSKFERILLNELNREDVRIDRLAYDLTRFLGIRILHLPMMREQYLSSLSEEQFEGLRSLISCMGDLEPVVVGARYKAIDYITYALNHPNEIELMSRGIQALTRLYKKFQADPIRSDSAARFRTMAGFLPAYIVFGDSIRLPVFNGVDEDDLYILKFRQMLQWVIDHEGEFAYLACLRKLVSTHWGEPMSMIAEFHGGRFPEFDEMSFALDRVLREPLGGRPYWFQTRPDLCDSLAKLGLSLPGRIFTATIHLGGMKAIDEPWRAQLLRIVPLFVKLFRANMNVQLPPLIPPRKLYRILDILTDPLPTDQFRLGQFLDTLENVISTPQTTPTM